MENLSLVYDGKNLPELYHFGFNGSHFQIFLSESSCLGLMEAMGNISHLGKDFIPPALHNENFGFAGSASLSRTLNQGCCIAIPAVFDTKDYLSLRSSAKTLSITLIGLSISLYNSAERGESAESNESQLFELRTIVGEKDALHAGGFELSVSHTARRYLETLGKNIRFPEAMRAMKHHADIVWSSGDDNEGGLSIGHFDVRLRSRGVIGMDTLGDCACLGTAPKDFKETEGYHLLSHNVDGLLQQFNLLVGVAYIWQMVRNGVRGQVQL